jgi:hypothetical protein
MKGQFFIIGGLFICVLLFLGMGPQVGITRTGTDDMDRLGRNLEKEMPHALNIGINGSDPVGVLCNFTGFSLSVAQGRRMNATSYWLVFRPVGGEVNVTAANFMGSPLGFVINVSGVAKGLYADHSSVNSTTFSVSGYTYDAEVTVDGESAAFTLLTNKTSIYGIMTLERAGNVVSKEILA